MITIDQSLQGLSLPEFISKCQKDIDTGFPFFCERCLGLDKTKEFHIEWIKAFEENPRSLIEASRQHGKSKMLGMAYPIYKAFFNDGVPRSFLVVSHRMDWSIKILRNIKDAISNSELLSVRLIPDRKTVRRWTKTEMNTKTNCEILAKPNTDAIRGGTHNWVLADEVSKFEDHGVYFAVILPTVGSTQGHVMCIGTPTSGVDLLSKIKDIAEQKGGYFIGRYPAFKENEKGKLVGIWPEMYSPKQWKVIKAGMSSLEFEQEYMCNIVDKKTQIIPLNSVIDAYHNDMFFDKAPRDGTKYYMGCDLASSPDGDYNVYTLIRVDSQGFVTFAYTQRTHGMSLESRAMRISELYQLFNPERVVIDKSLDGKELISILVQKHGVPSEGFVFRPENRYPLITNLIMLFENRRITIPHKEGDFMTTPSVDILTKELTDMVRDVTPTNQPTYKTLGRHEDTVIALALAVYAAGSSVSTIGGSGDYVITDGPKEVEEDEGHWSNKLIPPHLREKKIGADDWVMC